MIIQRNILSQSGFDPNMKGSESRSFSAEGSIHLTIDNRAIAGLGSYKKSKDGKLPRVVVRAKAEAESTALRSRMQEARVELASHFFDGEPPSLVNLRLQRGYSQQQLAALLGTSQSHIAKLETGKVRPLFETVECLADALGVSLDEIRPLIRTSRERKSTNVR